MISIDNAVELMVKIYLGLPQRVTSLKISRKEYQEFSESFPLLQDALQKYASDKLDGIDLGEIEWYHRLREITQKLSAAIQSRQSGRADTDNGA